MISSYNFSLVGRDHIKSNMPCHDFSLIEDISASWKIAVVADGVGSCKHAELASEIAVKQVAELIKKQFPPYTSDEKVYLSVIYSAMHGAANAIEAYVEENDAGNEMEYQTTLSVAVMSKKNLYYGNAGDSGIIALDDNGQYHLVTKKQNDDIGRVYSIPNHREFEVGKADFIPVAALCMTDGLYDFVAPEILRDSKFLVNVPFANLFITYALGIEDSQEPEEVEVCKNRVIDYLQSEECKVLNDDLSIAALVNTSSDLQKEDIQWEEPQIDYYALKWKEVSIYPSIETRNTAFKEFIRQKNPEWTEEQVNDCLKMYSDSDNNEKEATDISLQAHLNESQQGSDLIHKDERKKQQAMESLEKETRGFNWWKKRP